MKKNIIFRLTPIWSLIVIMFVGCILSCEENGLATKSFQEIEAPNDLKNDDLPLPERMLGVTTCATDKDRESCDADRNGYCECVGSNCNRYCYEFPYTLFRLIERGRICGTNGSCIEPNLERLILYFHIDELTQPLSVLVTEKNEVFAKSRLLNYDKKNKIATIGYEMVNPELIKNELFIQIAANFKNKDGKLVSLNLLSEAIPAGHFSK